jgi:WD40 repeat protein
MRTQLRTEINVISECLRGDNNSLPPLQPTTSIESMDPGEWIENQPPTQHFGPEIQSCRIPFPPGQKKSFSTAGLSPACSYVFFLNENMLLVHSLSSESGRPGDQPVLLLDALKAKYYAAAISESFVAILLEESVKKVSQKSLRIVRFNGQELGTATFRTESSGHKWDASSLIAIHTAGDRTWIAIGGCVRQDGVPSGSIKIYRIDDNAQPATLVRHSVSFTRTRPNPLAKDFLKTLAFSPDGKRLVCATNDNRVLVWRLSNNARPQGAPFIFEKELKRVSSHQGFLYRSYY